VLFARSQWHFVPMIAIAADCERSRCRCLSCMPFCALVLPTFRWPKERLSDFQSHHGPKPVPARLTCCGLPVALSVMFMGRGAAPNRSGSKRDTKCAIRSDCHRRPASLVCAKSPGFRPLMTIPVMDNGEPRVFVRVKFEVRWSHPEADYQTKGFEGDKPTVSGCARACKLTVCGCRRRCR